MNLKELIEKRNGLVKQAQDMLETAKLEKREVSADELKAYDQIKADLADLDAKIKMAEEVRALQMKPAERGDATDAKPEIRSIDGGDVNMREVADMAQFIRNRAENLRDDPINLSKSANGAVIPETIGRWITRRVYDVSPLLQRSQRYNTKGKLSLPVYDETSGHITVGYQPEFAQMTSQVGKFVTVTLEGYLCGALTMISRSLLNNTDLDLVSFIVNQMGLDIARFIEGELIHGTQDAVEGLSGLTNTVETAGQGIITADDIVELHDEIKDVYQRDAVWIMSPGTRTALRLLKDQMGRYMLQDDISLPFGTSLLGKPVYVSDNMPDIDSADGAPVIFYGDMTGLVTKFSEGISIEVLRELYSPLHAVGVQAWFEFDAKVIDNQKIVGLTIKS